MSECPRDKIIKENYMEQWSTALNGNNDVLGELA